MNACEAMAVLSAAPAGSRGGIPIGGAVLGPGGGPAIGIVDKAVPSPLTGEITHPRILQTPAARAIYRGRPAGLPGC